MAGGFSHETNGDTPVEWYTPAWIFQAMGVQFTLDPCSPVGGPLPWVPALKRYTKDDNGLIQPWFGRVWLNPPYGKLTDPFLKKMAEHSHGIALVFARTDPKWFQEVVAPTADAVCFMSKRVKFVDRSGKPPLNKNGKKSGPGAGSMLIAWGEDCVKILERSGLGTMMYFKQKAA